MGPWSIGKPGLPAAPLEVRGWGAAALVVAPLEVQTQGVRVAAEVERSARGGWHPWKQHILPENVAKRRDGF